MPIWVTVLLVAAAVGVMVWQGVVRARLRRTGGSAGRPSPVAIVLLVALVAAVVVLNVVHH